MYIMLSSRRKTGVQRQYWLSWKGWKAFTKLYILGARGKIYANVTIDVAFAIFLWRKFLSVVIVQFQKRNLQTKFAASKRCKILKSISIVFDNCSYVKLQVSKLNDLGKLAVNQQVYIFTPKLANTLTRHCFGLVIDAKLSSITKKVPVVERAGIRDGSI